MTEAQAIEQVRAMLEFEKDRFLLGNPRAAQFISAGYGRVLSRGEKAAHAAMRAEIEDEAVRELDEIHRDDAAVRRVLEIVKWLW